MICITSCGAYTPEAASATQNRRRPREGTSLFWSADFLTYSMSSPNHYGMIPLADGGRFMADIPDVGQGRIDSGSKVRMAFRIEDSGLKRGFVRHFWKAAPL